MFSVLIPSFNHERYLQEAVFSALESKLVSEILLVDDGSKDRSIEICKELVSHSSRIRFFEDPFPTNRGAHERINQLCKIASSSWLAVLNSDDKFLSGRFEEIAAAIRLTDGDLFFSSLKIIGPDNETLGCKRGPLEPEYPFPELGLTPPYSKDDLFFILANQNYISTTTNMVFSKELFKRVGGFRDYRYVHDWDFALRAFILGNPVFIPKILAAYRIHPSNTIKESSSKVDAEVENLFRKLTKDFPSLHGDAKFQLSLKFNRHIRTNEQTGSGCSKAVDVPNAANFDQTWLPEKLNSFEKGVAELVFKTYKLDFAIINRRFLPSEMVEKDSLKSRIVCSPSLRAVFEGKKEAAGRIVGRVLCIPGASQSEEMPTKAEFSDLPAVFKNKWVVLNGGLTEPMCEKLEISSLPDRILGSEPKKIKTRVLVLPSIFAVGGVERNTLEVISTLRDEYDFAIVTFEHHPPFKTTLHHQAAQLGIPILDLAEIAEEDCFEELLELLRKRWDPDIVWICNGCPWLAKNTWLLRRIFNEAAIIDQQAYDTRAGWVNIYGDLGIQSFDRFIAINSKIKRHFISKLGMNDSQIDLIYPAFNSSRFSAEKKKSAKSDALRSLGIQKAQKIFASVGRLAEQKQPLKFIDLAHRAQLEGMDARFVLVGDGELKGECASAIASLKLKNITMISFCEDVSMLWQCADALVMTSIYEGLPVVVLECLAMGKPVFSTDVGDVELVVSEGNAGIIIPVESTLDMSWSAFKLFINNLDNLQENAERYSSDIRKKFGIAYIADQYRACFTRALLGDGPVAKWPLRPFSGPATGGSERQRGQQLKRYLARG